VALCSYDNTLNQRYKFTKEIEMARQTAEQKAAEQKAAEEAAKRAEEEAKAKLEAEQKAAEQKAAEEADAGEDDDMTILDALKQAERGAKLRRKGWSKALDSHYITIRRGESLPVLTTGKHASPYTPSIVDVMAADWEEI